MAHKTRTGAELEGSDSYRILEWASANHCPRVNMCGTRYVQKRTGFWALLDRSARGGNQGSGKPRPASSSLSLCLKNVP